MKLHILSRLLFAVCFIPLMEMNDSFAVAVAAIDVTQFGAKAK